MKRADFTRRWITHMLASADETLDEETKAYLMESCGRACARCGVIGSAEACHGDLSQFLSTLGGWVGEANVRVDGDTVHVVYDKCYCQIDAEIPEDLAKTYCSCSRGWLMEMFETVIGKPVQVELASSIKRGADRCTFEVIL